ncbi:MAG: hypothetical protein H0X38_04485 [Planctomycetes bacterium]|nr:hypothetical protein [Planctomycetota bacterium]
MLAAGLWRARALPGLLLAALLSAQLGCGNRQAVDGSGRELTIVVEKEFVKHLSPYQPWPDLDSIFDHADEGNVRTVDDLKSLPFLLILAVPVVVVAEVTGLTYHNLHGVQIWLTVRGEGETPPGPFSAHLRWGKNRVVIPESALASLMTGTPVLHIDVEGTREVHLRIPTTGMEWMHAAHSITLAADGQLLVDGQVVEISKAVGPEPPPKLGSLRGQL